MSLIHQVDPECPIRLSDSPTRGEEFVSDREDAERQTKKLRQRLQTYQGRLYAESKQQLLIVLQARDAGGKDGTIRKVFSGVNPQGVRVHSFKVPTPEELAHDFLWRVHARTPARGMIGIFNRSHYEDVLVVRVREIVPEAVWRPRFHQINEFEALLASSGTRILKFYLHISKEEQLERFRARLEDPEKHWKFSPDDLNKRKLWEGYTEAYEEMLQLCSTPAAPWFVIPADQKWYRNLAITRVIVETLEEMDPQFPAPDFDPETYEIGEE